MIYNNPNAKASYTEKFFDLPNPSINRGSIAELGRFALAPEARSPRVSLLVRLGLLQIACKDALDRGVSHFYVFMHSAGYVLLRRSGIPFDVIQGYTVADYEGYYSDYFDPSDTYPALINITSALAAVGMKINSSIK